MSYECIKVLIPDMPTRAELTLYLAQIDTGRWYSNEGPLVKQLQKELAQAFDCDHTDSVQVSLTSSGTMALQAAFVSAKKNSWGVPNVVIPTLTHPATVLAALQARCHVTLSDISSVTWQLDLDRLPATAPIDILCPVATFGLPINMVEWRETQRKLGNRVIADCAGAWGNIKPWKNTEPWSYTPEVIACFSLHATKLLGAGEGGANITYSKFAKKMIDSHVSFGAHGTNGRMSEYHAAVALASLIKFPQKQAKLIKYKNLYRQWLLKKFTSPMLEADSSVSSLFVVKLPDEYPPVGYVQNYLHARGIETRQWYGPLMHQREEFKNFDRTGDLKNTEKLAERLLGLPFHTFLEPEDIERVCYELGRLE